jgi:hypothetical protein
MNKMYFWRDKNFHSLTEAASFSSEIPDWKDYSEYCSLLERGLRKAAFLHLSKFIDSAISWNFSQKRQFASWLFHFAYTNPDCFQLMPQPLSKRLLEPTLTEWTEREPDCAEPHRWLGRHEHLRQAIELEPKDEIARQLLIEKLFYGVHYSTHEIPYGYIGKPQEDLLDLDEIESLLLGITDTTSYQLCTEAMSKYRIIINDYLQSQTTT